MSETSAANGATGGDEVPAAAAEVAVSSGDVITLPGWAIRSDTVLVHASGLPDPIRVATDGEWVTAVDTFEAAVGVESEQRWTAIELPEGTLEVDGEAFPPGVTPPATDPTRTGARIAFWCLIFPRMRGC